MNEWLHQTTPGLTLKPPPLWGGQNVACSSTLGPGSTWSTPFLAGRDSTAWFEQATREVWQLELSHLDESMDFVMLLLKAKKMLKKIIPEFGR